MSDLGKLAEMVEHVGSIERPLVYRVKVKDDLLALAPELIAVVRASRAYSPCWEHADACCSSWCPGCSAEAGRRAVLDAADNALDAKLAEVLGE